MLALIVLVVLLDQGAKWWAWRHLSWAKINFGGDELVGTTIGGWYAGPVSGALLDLLDFGLLSAAVTLLARYRVPAAVTVPGALMTGGWGSNLLDRLGIHYWTAPGSVRGVVDFIHLGGHYYNVADFFIISCTPLFLLAAAFWGARSFKRPPAANDAGYKAPLWGPKVSRVVPRGTASLVRSWAQLRAALRIPALAGAGLALVVSLGAAHYGGLDATPNASPRPGIVQVPAP